MSKTWKEAYDPKWKRGVNFYCAGKALTSLEGAPSHVNGDFTVRYNHLDSFEGAPSYVNGTFDCSDNRVTSLEGAPSFVGTMFYCNNNKFTSLKDIRLQVKHIGTFAYFDFNPIESHVLGLLLIDGLKQVSLDNRQVRDILNRHLPSKGMESVLLCQEELINAGFEEYAQL